MGQRPIPRMVQRGKARCEKATEVVQRCRRMKVSSVQVRRVSSFKKNLHLPKETLWIWGAVVDVQSFFAF